MLFFSSHQIHKGNVNEETSCNSQNPSIGLVTIGTDGHTNEQSKHRSERTAKVEKEGSAPVDATLQQNGIITCDMCAGVTNSAKESPVTPFSSLFLLQRSPHFFHSSLFPSVVSTFHHTPLSLTLFVSLPLSSSFLVSFSFFLSLFLSFSFSHSLSFCTLLTKFMRNFMEH